ncbi:MAG: cytochrome c5 family protein [Betaproteobacteria bacterium HGW-Betaproteobacteria-11]|nr:MAG: cytochrome c5 family protein [Betaproteobacteria bacterium HGW-Betaproteobacteria-11]
MTQESKESLRPFALLIGGMVVLIVFAVVLASLIGAKPKIEDEEAVNDRIAPLAKVDLAAAGAATAGDRTGEQIYQAACQACHATGAAGAPKLGDKAAWAPRLGQGLAGLLKSVANGKNAMPPKGGSDANETELARATVFMANQSGGKLKEPAAK